MIDKKYLMVQVKKWRKKEVGSRKDEGRRTNREEWMSEYRSVYTDHQLFRLRQRTTGMGRPVTWPNDLTALIPKRNPAKKGPICQHLQKWAASPKMSRNDEIPPIIAQESETKTQKTKRCSVDFIVIIIYASCLEIRMRRMSIMIINYIYPFLNT